MMMIGKQVSKWRFYLPKASQYFQKPKKLKMQLLLILECLYREPSISLQIRSWYTVSNTIYRETVSEATKSDQVIKKRSIIQTR